MPYSKTRFLVVEDQLTMRKVITTQLRNRGAVSIVEASDGHLGWEQLEKELAAGTPIQFVISDWHMPTLKGIDLLRKCRAHEAYKDIAFILVTEEADAAQVREAIEAGVDGYILKPFNASSLGEGIATAHAKRIKTAES